ncbi:FAD-dependent oxidoreductase [Actinoplanes sp. TFC3]|uniref:FAD-dependent oxidoreductase n=1 Tax=Actinoplanes sp. TFC3 TaxID=1710355 RepID=UPI0008324BE2|nr:FAD-dependent oxidoreductase [Actinoplanes sp. TFC3]
MLTHVFRPGTIGTLRLAHRIVMGAMHLNLEQRDDDGAALAAFYAERARGGAALIVTGGVAVSAQGAGGPGYGVISADATRVAVRRVVEQVHAAGGRLAVQLFHAGRYALPGVPGVQTSVAPSAVPSRFARSTPRELSAEQITETVGDFARAAVIARDLGCDAVEIMGSEGYLINQFTAPLTNLRDDAWGGDAERRRRFPVAVLQAVRAAVGAEFPVLFRMSGADLVAGGTPDDEVAALAVALAGAGVDALAVGVGWHESAVPTVQAQVPAGAWAGRARSVKQALRAGGHGKVAVIAANRFDQLDRADAELAAGDVDFVALARPFLADPAIVAKSRAGAAGSVELCIACNEACIDRSFGTETVSCLVNPRAGYELEFPVVRAARAGRYAVIGAGPAGLEAARELARQGHDVTVYEAAPEPGGQFRLAAAVPGKSAFGETVRRRVRELSTLGVALRLGHRVGPGDLGELASYDGVLLTTGVRPRRPELPGLDLPHVFDYPQVFADPGALGPRVVIIGGGGIALDVAHLLTARPLTTGFPSGWPPPGPGPVAVTLMRRGGRIGQGVGASTRWVVLAELRAAGVEMLTGVQYRRIVAEGVQVIGADGQDRLIRADHVVLATGQEPEPGVAQLLRTAAIPFLAAGGAAGAEQLNAVRAAAEGLRAARHAGALVAAGEWRP